MNSDNFLYVNEFYKADTQLFLIKAIQYARVMPFQNAAFWLVLNQYMNISFNMITRTSYISKYPVNVCN